MSKTNNGGPAFLSMRDMRHNPDFDHEEGMTLRDYFAGKAIQGLLASPKLNLDSTKDSLAHQAYSVADAMLEARNK